MSSLIGVLIWTALAAPPTQAGGLVLDGVIVAANPADSVALVRKAGPGGRARILRVGQEIQGYVLLEVAKGEARFRGLEGELLLRLSGAPVAAKRVEDAPPRAGGESEWIRRAFPREAARARLEKEMPVILNETDLDSESRGRRGARTERRSPPRRNASRGDRPPAGGPPREHQWRAPRRRGSSLGSPPAAGRPGGDSNRRSPARRSPEARLRFHPVTRFVDPFRIDVAAVPMRKEPRSIRGGARLVPLK